MKKICFLLLVLSLLLFSACVPDQDTGAAVPDSTQQTQQTQQATDSSGQDPSIVVPAPDQMPTKPTEDAQLPPGEGPGDRADELEKRDQ